MKGEIILTLKEYVANKGFTMSEFQMFDKKTQEQWREEQYILNREEQIERDRFPSTFMHSIDFVDEEDEIAERETTKKQNANMF